MRIQQILGCLMMAAIANGAWAQGSTRSPYSQFGIGMLDDLSQSASRGMNGVGYALRQGNEVNTLNPASYSGVDSLTMLFDMGVSGQLTNFKEGARRQNAAAASFEYAVGSFRAWKNVGMAFGILPFSSVGYDYSSTTRSSATGILKQAYTGSGGLHQLFLGAGWNVFGPLSVGINAAYLWGHTNRTITPSSSAASNTLTKTYSTTIKNYKLDFGLQWQQTVGKTDRIIIGGVFGLGHNLKNDADMEIISTNSVSSKKDTTTVSIGNAYALPMSFGAGVSYNHAGKLTLAADLNYERWESVKVPDYEQGTTVGGQLMDRKKLIVGLDFLPNPTNQSGKYMEHVHYRLGAGYSTPYYKINGCDGPAEFSVSAGVALPIVNAWNNRSVLSVSGQWVRRSATDFITENTFRINIGITFNERWFMKWKVD